MTLYRPLYSVAGCRRKRRGWLQQTKSPIILGYYMYIILYTYSTLYYDTLSSSTIQFNIMNRLYYSETVFSG